MNGAGLAGAVGRVGSPPPRRGVPARQDAAAATTSSSVLKSQVDALEDLARLFGDVEQRPAGGSRLRPRSADPTSRGAGALREPLLAGGAVVPRAPPAAARLPARPVLGLRVPAAQAQSAAGHAGALVHDPMPQAEADALTPLPATRPMLEGLSARVGCWARLLKKHLNPQFARDAEVSGRGALFVVLLSLPLLLPPEVVGRLTARLPIAVAYRPEAVLYIVYALSHTVGQTLRLLSCGAAGVGISLLDVWAMCRLLPHTDGARFAAVMLNGMLFLAAMLGLNFNTNTAIFGCASFCVCWMEMLKDTQDVAAPLDMAIQELRSCLAGSICCFVCVLLPYPLTATGETEEVVTELVTAVGSVWDGVVGHYCMKSDNVYRQRKMMQTLRSMEVHMRALESLLDDSWWECLLSRRRRCRGRLLRALRRHLSEALDRAEFLQQYCLSEKFEVLHKQVMSSVATEAQEVAKRACSLLELCAGVALMGRITQEESAAVSEASAAVERAATRFAARFVEAKRWVGLPGLSPELLEEHAFSAGVCMFARTCTDYAESVSHIFAAPDAKAWSGIKLAFSSVVAPGFQRSPVCHPERARFLVRNWLAICGAMALGYFGLGSGIGRYDATVAAFCALMLNRSSGSGLTRSLARVQGVVLGIALGQTAHAAIAGCDPINVAVLGGLLFFTAVASLFVFLHAETHAVSHVGLMAAAFGAISVVGTPCAAQGADGALLLRALLATGAVSAAEMLSAPQSASTLAHGSLVRTWAQVEAVVREVLDEGACAFRLPGEEIKARIAETALLSEEAQMAPRLWRPVWRSRLFAEATDSAAKFRVNLSSLGYGLAVGPDAPGAAAGDMEGGVVVRKPYYFRQVVEVAGFRTIGQMLLDEIAQHKELLAVFARDSPGEPPELSDAALAQWRGRLAEWESRLGVLIRSELQPKGAKDSGLRPGQTLEHDFCAQVSLVVVAVKMLMGALGDFRRAALST